MIPAALPTLPRPPLAAAPGPCCPPCPPPRPPVRPADCDSGPGAAVGVSLVAAGAMFACLVMAWVKAFKYLREVTQCR